MSLSVPYDGPTRAFVLEFGSCHVLDALMRCTTIAAALSAGCKDLVRLIEAPEISVPAAHFALCDETDRSEWIGRGSRLRQAVQGAVELSGACLGLWNPHEPHEFTRVIIDNTKPISWALVLWHNDGCGYVGGAR